MEEQNGTIRILGFAGSLRSASFNRKLLAAAQDLAPEGMEIEIFDLKDIPLYNGDVESEGDPVAVTEFKEKIRAANGLLIVTPEYNSSIPAVTKNAVDWASRPPEPPLGGKPVGILGGSPGRLGTVYAQEHLRLALMNPQCRVMLRPAIFVDTIHKKFDEAGTLTDEVTRGLLVKFLESLRDWTAAG